MRPPRPSSNPRPRVFCPLCGVDVAVSKAGRLTRHQYIVTPVWARVWCPYGGTVPTEPLTPCPTARHP